MSEIMSDEKFYKKLSFLYDTKSEFIGILSDDEIEGVTTIRGYFNEFMYILIFKFKDTEKFPKLRNEVFDEIKKDLNNLNCSMNISKLFKNSGIDDILGEN